MDIFKTQAVFEDSGVSLMARVKGPARTYILQANISSLSVKVYNKADGTQVGTEYVPLVADAVFDTLQTDEIWTRDAIGYNLRIDCPETLLPTGGIVCTIEVLATPTTGTPFCIVYETPVRALNRS